MTTPSRPRSPLWLVVLALACEEPMHPYRMQTLIRQRGKDHIANVAQRNSVYQTIDALMRAGLVKIQGTSRDERHPERTLYEATEEGRQALRAWVTTGLSTPAREFPEFPAVLSVLYGLGADDLRVLLETRVEALERRVSDLEKPVPNVPRVFLLEEEYMAAVARAEVKWLRGVIADLRSGKLTFPTLEEMLRLGAEMGAPSEEAVRRIAAEMHGPAPGEEAPRKVRGKRPGSDTILAHGKRRGATSRGRPGKRSP